MAWSKASRQSRGYGRQWERLRKAVLERDGFLCQPCKASGRVKLGNQVDHIKPKAKGGTDDPANLQAICEPCHKTKTIKDSGKTVKPVTGKDGWPVDSKV